MQCFLGKSWIPTLLLYKFTPRMAVQSPQWNIRRPSDRTFDILAIRSAHTFTNKFILTFELKRVKQYFTMLTAGVEMLALSVRPRWTRLRRVTVLGWYGRVERLSSVNKVNNGSLRMDVKYLSKRLTTAEEEHKFFMWPELSHSTPAWHTPPHSCCFSWVQHFTSLCCLIRLYEHAELQTLVHLLVRTLTPRELLLTSTLHLTSCSAFGH